MEHIAFALKKDPWEIRMANMMQKGSEILASPGQILEQDNPLVSLIQEFKKETDYEKRVTEVEAFNKVSDCGCYNSTKQELGVIFHFNFMHRNLDG